MRLAGIIGGTSLNGIDVAIGTDVEQLTQSAQPPAAQIRLFEPAAAAIEQKIRALKIDEARPLEALRFVQDLQRELDQCA